MFFWILIVIICFGVRHLALRLPIPPELVRQYREREVARHHAAPAKRGTDASRTGDEDWVRRRDDDDEDDGTWSDPDFNIDGTLMLGDFDVNGNPFGITDE